MRILADLPDDDVKWLETQARQQGKSRAAVLREAVSTFRAQPARDTNWLEAGFGLWARNGLGMDPAEHDRLRRAEWVRPWDDAYDDVRAESPDCFTPEDDRERAHYMALLAMAAAAESPGKS